MAKAQLYKIKLVQGFNAAGRKRAGIVLAKGQTVTMELTDVQLMALNNDIWVDVQKVGKADKTVAPAEESQETEAPADVEQADTDSEEVDLTEMSFKELKTLAAELELDTKGLKSKADVIKLIEESQETEE